MERIQLIEKENHTENHFRLRNLVSLRHNDGSSMNELLECVMYNAKNYSETFSVGKNIRYVRRRFLDDLNYC